MWYIQPLKYHFMDMIVILMMLCYNNHIDMQDTAPTGIGPFWGGEQGGVAVGPGVCGGGREDSEERLLRGGHGQVPAGGSHHGPVQTPQHRAADRHCDTKRTGR